jgi:hypothetical protein
MPGEVRELTFPEGIPLAGLETEGLEVAPGAPGRRKPAVEEPAMISTDAEAGLHTDADEIGEQARRSRTPEEGENLLESGDN